MFQPLRMNDEMRKVYISGGGGGGGLSLLPKHMKKKKRKSHLANATSWARMTANTNRRLVPPERVTVTVGPQATTAHLLTPQLVP